MKTPNPLSSVIIRLREGAVSAATAHLGWELIVDGLYVGNFASKADAEAAAIQMTVGL